MNIPLAYPYLVTNPGEEQRDTEQRNVTSDRQVIEVDTNPKILSEYRTFIHDHGLQKGKLFSDYVRRPHKVWNFGYYLLKTRAL